MDSFLQRIFFYLLSIGVGTLVAGVSASGQSPMVNSADTFQLLKSYQVRSTENNYSGIFIIDSSEGAMPFRVHHSANKTLISSIEGLIYDIQMTDTLRAIYTKNAAAEILPLQYDALLWPSITLDDKSKALFQFERRKTHRVCNRQAEVIVLTPLASDKYSLRLYLDPATGLMLKKDILDKQGELIESYTFVMLDVGHTSESMTRSRLSKTESHQNEVSLSPRSPEQPLSPIALGMLPQGFMQTDISHDAGDWVIGFSDGIFHATVFLSLAGSEQACPQKDNVFGSFSAFCRTLTLDKKYYQVMVTGNLPLQTVKKMAESIH